MLGKSICAFAVFVVWCTGVLLGYFFSFSFYQREEETVLKYVVYGLFTVVHISHNTNIFSSLVYLKKKTKYLCGWILHLQFEICCCLIILFFSVHFICELRSGFVCLFFEKTKLLEKSIELTHGFPLFSLFCLLSPVFFYSS